MVSIVKCTNKKTGVTYVYESESYWDKEKKQPRNRRKLVGKIDPETGEVVPTGGRGRGEKTPKAPAEAEALEACRGLEGQLAQKERDIQRLLLEKRQVEKDYAALRDGLKSLLEKSGQA